MDPIQADQRNIEKKEKRVTEPDISNDNLF